jgi:nucleoside-diphosphate-sugar epimerase
LRVLVTGAGGFLGRRVVDAFVRRGHEVRALVRPAGGVAFDPPVDVRRLDLRAPDGLPAALEGVDAVVHLAAQVRGSDEARFAGTVVTTENLLEAMTAAGVRRLVLASSYSVYDWSRTGAEIDERAPLEASPYERDGYAVAKVWQERVARRTPGLELTVLRPGYIWGGEQIAGVGPLLGPLQLVIGPFGRLPLTHVENCADCFVTAAETAGAAGATLNVDDGHGVRTWRFARDTAAGQVLVPVPYGLALGVVRAVYAVARVLLGPRLRLPSLFVPRRFEARFKPVRTSRAEIERVLGWRPPLGYDEALARTRS